MHGEPPNLLIRYSTSSFTDAAERPGYGSRWKATRTPASSAARITAGRIASVCTPCVHPTQLAHNPGGCWDREAAAAAARNHTRDRHGCRRIDR
eukprot:6491227-Pyramimonas_sp.AAC.2